MRNAHPRGRRRLGVLAFAAALLAFLGSAAPVGAQDLETAEEHLRNGDFAVAAGIGASLGTGEGYIIAARAIAYYARYEAPKDKQEELYAQGVEYAEKAMALAPDDPRAYLEFAHTSGRYARQIGVVAALNEGMAGKIRDAIEKALELDPDNPLALASFGSWHAEIVNAAGRIMANLLYGAKRSEALSAYEKAIAAEPEDPAVYREVARGLLLVDDATYASRAEELLHMAIALPPKGEIDRIEQRKSRRLLEEMRS